MTSHMEITATIEPGDVVLIGGPGCARWAGCLLQVEQVKSWGVTGSVIGPDGLYYPLRVGVENINTVFRERR